MHRSRRGFSAVELLMVAVVAGILSAIVMPRAYRLFHSASVQSAAQTVATSLAHARATAIQSGREARFSRSGNIIVVTLYRPGGLDTVSAPRDLYAQHGVTLRGPVAISFNARGFADGSSRNEAIIVASDEKEQSVCIVGLSKITIRNCP